MPSTILRPFSVGPGRSFRRTSLATLYLVAAALLGCLPELPVGGERVGSGVGGDSGGLDALARGKDGALAPLCRPLLSGELLLNEIVVRPGGLDVDGDGASTGRDEVIEVVSLADEPAHALGVRLRVDGVERGVVVSAPCLPAGASAILVGSTTADAGIAASMPTLRLDHTLRLRDSALVVELGSVAGGVHDSASLKAWPGNGAAVWTRSPDAQPQSAWLRHVDVPPHRPWSLGSCSVGGAFPGCVVELLSR